MNESDRKYAEECGRIARGAKVTAEQPKGERDEAYELACINFGRIERGQDDTIPRIASEIRALVSRREDAAAERMRERACAVVGEYLRAYPEDVFPAPAVGEHGGTVDACSAAALRAVLPHVRRDLSELPLREE